ncbi:MAG: hypothetical protein ACQESP_10135 [Candidatus Muiribacteriota bacterium]
MFSKHDFIELVKQIRDLEDNMRDHYQELYDKVETIRYKEILKKLVDDEKEHHHIVDKILEGL